MKLSILIISCAGVLALCGCQSTNSAGSSSSAVLAAAFTPEHIAQATTDSLSIVGALVLGNNPSYSGSVQAAADAFTALAQSNPNAITGADIASALSKTGMAFSLQQEIATGATLALAIYERDFAANLPALKTNYALFATAIANGLLGALGKPPLPAAAAPSS